MNYTIHFSQVVDYIPYLIGGAWEDWFGDQITLNDVWSSIDGRNWELVTERAAFFPRYEHSAVVAFDKIWVLGGAAGGIESMPMYPMDDIWYSEIIPRTAVQAWDDYR